MNKKFFTLIASAFMLVASLGTVNAQTMDLAIGTDAVAEDKLPDTKQNSNLYHLIGNVGGTDFALTVNEDGYLSLQDAAAYPGLFGESLWCIEVADAEIQGQNPTFEFTNKANGFKLRVSEEDLDLDPTDPDATVNVEFGNLSRFEFSRIYEEGLEDTKPLVLYYKKDYVLALVELSPGKVGVQSYLATDDLTDTSLFPEVILFTVYKPAPITLTAEQFNTVINTQKEGYISLNFVPAPTDKSPLQTPLWAEDVEEFADGTTAPTGWLTFEQKTDNAKEKYLRVDTVYTGVYGVKFLKFAFGDAPSDATLQKAAIEKQYYFQARYDVASDSLAIDVMQAIMPKEEYTGDWYLHPAPTLWDATGFTPESKDSLHVKLQDLVQNERSILTIGTTEVSTKIELGLTGCDPKGLNLTTVGNDLYVIKNAAGQTLIVPVYSDTVPKWVTLPANVDPNRIPAYQWVVEQTRKDYPTTSPIKITNREFGALQVKTIASKTVQLSDKAVNLYGADVYAANFTAVPLAQKKDPYLGYKYLEDDSVRFNTYDFNYLHEFDDERYLYIKDTKDSSIYVNNINSGRSQFQFVPQSAPKKYGYTTKEVANLAQLVKVAYALQVKDASRLSKTGAFIAIDNEHRYTVTKSSAVDSAIFHLKTNNTKYGKDYYALLDTGSFGYDNTSKKNVDNKLYGDVKLGIDDNSLWAFEQGRTEVRTSAFYPSPYNEPLYRRFDGNKYGKTEVQEPFDEDNAGDNSPKWLKFTRYNNFGNEFLFENSPRGAGGPGKDVNDYRDALSTNGAKTISFLGLYNINQYPETDDMKYTFYVDTAYVRNNTAKPQYMLALRPYILDADTTWCEDSHHAGQTHDDPNWLNCPHTVIRTRMVVADWLYNAQDSIGYDNDAPHNKDYVGKVEYGAEKTTRLAFVRGVHAMDTFYVLRGANATLAADQISTNRLYQIDARDKHYLGQNTHYKPRWYTGANVVTANTFTDANNGKSMVFQFRLYAPEKDRTFLIESRQDDGEEMGPNVGRWVKIQNGVPVVSEDISLSNAKQNGADIFDVMAGDENMAVGNEDAVSAGSEVKVISEAGAVTILNANGKNVAISNILGQTVANQTLNSNSATIALPKGIVVVAVEGEKAVKAIVK
ncbi:hypothetical protein M2459_000604 [Parabacteroides sp. PF5-5]|uniref:DUF6383 domain-containing protein n=1 Tax=unclassified Parabacteroides TaxID=2649774 RepID=UPI0024749D4D|nr:MULTISPECIES: DUF6383 domain-containing protein [unclassified Parabacteroides]MDH6303463.1 hypothetical protein [Parabacteroides sp. PH5-39]MDH6314785.1 hypothetical protein [Parabacteroides sp. PF5-13]MDH6318122.1 hypothetical protein [Parabacteroides sp. PH5-13]MDH6321946.1 hypothetical protein [Parabacteroides sp. PH5-8]MDH6326070.1 hypothetical protein [Parabacteroides sp. PH5-41]